MRCSNGAAKKSDDGWSLEVDGSTNAWTCRYILRWASAYADMLDTCVAGTHVISHQGNLLSIWAHRGHCYSLAALKPNRGSGNSIIYIYVCNPPAHGAGAHQEVIRSFTCCFLHAWATSFEQIIQCFITFLNTPASDARAPSPSSSFFLCSAPDSCCLFWPILPKIVTAVFPSCLRAGANHREGVFTFRTVILDSCPDYYESARALTYLLFNPTS